ncbi:fimbria/pilus outer membrane usher protein [Photobacterium leiognathi]|uniref:fimbria/pilus outer membrane usher protein n=1 Tax=Photobacterium leiognathi TaxID=553611 RepID=UPI000769FCD7|nr:fimbria/pilus outer membrane usher protein [Photobacterium leiognathi]
MKLRIKIILFTLFYNVNCVANTYFDPHFLANDDSDLVDLKMFNNGLELPPGKYKVSIYVNGVYISDKEVSFVLNKNKTELVPILTVGYYIQLGVNKNIFKNKKYKDQVVDISKYIKSATTVINVSKMKLSITIPQADLSFNPKGYIPIDEWTNGVNAGLLNYNFSSGISKYGNNYESDNYLNLLTGINIGAWRFRDNSYLNQSFNSNHSNADISSFNNLSVYAERDLPSLRSRLKIGRIYTPISDSFTTLPLRGISLSSVDDMRPDSLLGYAPVIRGVAKSEATVSVYQDGNKVYQTHVASGPFVIRDINSLTGNGDLKVIVKEADGSKHSFIVPYASSPSLKRENQTDYAIAFGNYRGESGPHPTFMQATLNHGFSQGVTASTGVQLASQYQSYNIGLTKNLGSYGTLNTSITDKKIKSGNNRYQKGNIFGVKYQKDFIRSNINLGLDFSHYSKNGDLQLDDSEYFINDNTNNRNLNNTLSINLSKSFDNSLSFNVNDNFYSYYNNYKNMNNLNLSSSYYYKGIYFSLGLNSQSSYSGEGSNNSIYFNTSIPMSIFNNTPLNDKIYDISYGLSTDLNGDSSSQVGINGILDDGNHITYGLNLNRYKQSSGISANVNNNNNYGSQSLIFGKGDNGYNINFNASGGMIYYNGNIILGQPIYNSSALIEVNDAKNIKVTNQSDVKTNKSGFAIISSLNNYRSNRIALDPESYPNNVDIAMPIINVVPTVDAIVLAKFNAKIGYKALFKLHYKKGIIPFGASVNLLGDNNISSMVSTDGSVYLTGLPKNGKLNVEINKKESCKASYHLSNNEMKKSVIVKELLCQ